jgi:hypothetical protein
MTEILTLEGIFRVAFFALRTEPAPVFVIFLVA